MQLVKAHNKKSRRVEEADMEKVAELSEQMIALCKVPVGKYKMTGYAIAHCQVDDTDPLAFYVLATGKAIINPEIIKHSSYEVEKEEGCLWFPENTPAKVKRWQKCILKATVLDFVEDTIDDKYEENLSGLDAQIVQHEIDHLNAKTIFPIVEEVKNN